VKPHFWYLDAESTCLKTRNQGGQLSETVRYLIRCRVSEPGRDPVTIRMRDPLLVRIADLDGTVAGTANLEIRVARLADLRRAIERQATPATRIDDDEEIEGFEITRAEVRRLFATMRSRPTCAPAANRASRLWPTSCRSAPSCAT